MVVFDTANGSSTRRCGKSYDSILFVVTKGNQLEVLSKKNSKKKVYWKKKSVLKF